MARSHILTVLLTACLLIFLLWQLSLNFLVPTSPHAASPLDFKTKFSHGLPNDKSQPHASGFAANDDGTYLLGVGKGDITGPVVEINLMGYADMDQVGTGLRQRLYCRAFVIGSPVQPRDRIVYLVLDTQSGDTAIRHGILEGLQHLGGDYAALYTKDNVAVTGTHSHSGPGAWLNYLLPQITSKGFDKDSYQAIVNGSLLAIRRAHESLTPGHLSLGAQEVDSANINRSPYAYEANPAEERARYASDVDKTMTVLRFDRASDGQPLGMLSWFAVHGTSLYGNNTLISGDNKGVAAYLFERSMAASNPGFVAGFSQSNVGDTSPNVLGAYCEDTGLPCRHNDSTCDGEIKTCHGRGPFYEFADQGTRSCFEIGRRQFQAAKQIFNDQRHPRLPSNGIIASLHTFVNLSAYTFPSPFHPAKLLTTCSAALGHSFAGGTTDGPGAFDFKQGTHTNSSSPSQRNPLWKLARAFVHEPSHEQEACQAPKPILLDVGAAMKPYAWTPNIVDIQLMRVGPLVVIVSPGEATTMAGRRWREAVAKVAQAAGFGHQEDGEAVEPIVVLGGPANTYTHYIATREEYGVQRYEGASTLYGPNTLDAYIHLSLTHLPHLTSGGSSGKIPPGPAPPIHTNESLDFINPVVLDTAPLFKAFGDVVEDPDQARVYRPGELVRTRFVGANPRNNFRLQGSFAVVEMLRRRDQAEGGGQQGSDTWTPVRTDEDWGLVFRWRRTSTLLGTSEVSLEWVIEAEGAVDGVVVAEGLYRMRYFGDAKAVGGRVTPFEGVGGVFRVGGARVDREAGVGVGVGVGGEELV